MNQCLIKVTKPKPEFRAFFNPNEEETLENKKALFIEALKTWREECYIWRVENLNALPSSTPSETPLEAHYHSSSPFREWLQARKGRAYLFFLCCMLGIFIVNQFVYWFY